MAEFKEEIASAMAKLLAGKMEKEQILELIEVPPAQEMGDYSFPCFKLAAVLKKSPNAYRRLSEHAALYLYPR